MLEGQAVGTAVKELFDGGNLVLVIAQVDSLVLNSENFDNHQPTGMSGTSYFEEPSGTQTVKH